MENKNKYQVQEYLFGWYDLNWAPFVSIKGARSAIHTKIQSVNNRNKRVNVYSERGYGTESLMPMRIRNTETHAIINVTHDNENNPIKL